jgi:penicillin-binding protein activator
VQGKEVRYYQVNLELIDIQSNRKAWIGDKKIKKFVTRSRVGL